MKGKRTTTTKTGAALRCGLASEVDISQRRDSGINHHRENSHRENSREEERLTECQAINKRQKPTASLAKYNTRVGCEE